MASTFDEIEHIVVLMLENRSFDHMLAYNETMGAAGRKPDTITRFLAENPAAPFKVESNETFGDGEAPYTRMSHRSPSQLQDYLNPDHELGSVNIDLFGERKADFKGQPLTLHGVMMTDGF